MMDRKLSIDVLKIALAVMVVGIHANPVRFIGHFATNLAGQGLFRIAVPTFFVINGYFFHSIALSGRVGPYVRRLLWLYAAWTLLYLPIWYRVFLNPDPYALPRLLLIGWWQLWYLPALIIAALMVNAVRSWQTGPILGLVLGTFMVGAAISLAMAFGVIPPDVPILGDATALHRNGLLLGFPFLMAGFLIRRHNLAERIGLRGAIALTVLGIALVLAEAQLLDSFDDTGIGRDNLFALAIASPALLLLALQFDRQSPSKTLGIYANGIFFSHVAFCVIGIRYTQLGSGQIFLIALLGSVALTWALNRIGLAQRLL